MLADAVHEAGHAVAALTQGFQVSRMELFAVGGLTVTCDRHSPTQPDTPPSDTDSSANRSGGLERALAQARDADFAPKS